MSQGTFGILQGWVRHVTMFCLTYHMARSVEFQHPSNHVCVCYRIWRARNDFSFRDFPRGVSCETNSIFPKRNFRARQSVCLLLSCWLYLEYRAHFYELCALQRVMCISNVLMDFGTFARINAWHSTPNTRKEMAGINSSKAPA